MIILLSKDWEITAYRIKNICKSKDNHITKGKKKAEEGYKLVRRASGLGNNPQFSVVGRKAYPFLPTSCYNDFISDSGGPQVANSL